MRILLVAALAMCLDVGSAADFVLVRPSIQSPGQELGDEALQTQYNEMWERFGEAISTGNAVVEAELANGIKEATNVGSLDLALFWRDLSSEFSKTGKITWNSFELERAWRSKFGAIAFPKDFLPVLQGTKKVFDSETKKLEAGYGELELKLTQANMLDTALIIRDESRRLFDPNSQDENAIKAESTQKAGKEINLMPLVQLSGQGTLGAWKKNDQALLCDGDKWVRTSIDFKPPAEYDFGVVFKVMRGGELAQASSSADQKFFWLLRMYAKASPTGRFEVLSGKDSQLSATWPVNLKVSHHSVIRVRKEGITAVFDGKVVALVPEGLVTQSGCPTEWDYGDRLSLGTWNSTLAISRIYVRVY